jgi:hypothetical protein
VLEDVASELYRDERDLGDPATLVREDRHLRLALREMLGDPADPADDSGQYPPEPNTVALFDAIRAEPESTAGGGTGGEVRGLAALAARE